MACLKTLLIFLLFLNISLAKPSANDPILDSLNNKLWLLSKQKRSISVDSQTITTLVKAYIQLPSKEIAAREFLNDSLQKFAQKSVWNKAKGYQYYLNGFMHTFRGENMKAFNDIEKAMLHFEKLNDTLNYEVCFERLGVLIARNIMIKPITDSLLLNKFYHYTKQRLAEAKVKYNGVKLSAAYSSMGHYYLMKKNYHLSQENYAQTLKYAYLNTNKNTEFYEYNTGLFFSKGLCALYLNTDPKAAMATINGIIKTCQTQKVNNYEKYMLLLIIHYLGNYHCEKGEFDKALQLGLLGKKMKEPPQMPFYTYLYQNVLAKAYKGLNQLALAYPYLENTIAYQEKSGSLALGGSISEWQIKFEDEQNKFRIKTLENQSLQAKVVQQNWIRNFLIISLLAGLGFVFYFYKNNQKLIAKNKEIEQALVKGQTLERKRVAQELHDNLSAKISGIRWRLEAIKPYFEQENAEKVYQSSVNALAEVYTDVRLIAHNLLPAELETRGLSVAVQKLLVEINSFEKTQFIAKIDPDLGRFKSKIEYEVYSCILELSNNILKHAKATEATVAIDKSEKMLKIFVKDNGVGINEQIKASGMGMANLKSRIESLKGSITMQNNDGLQIQMEVPY